MRSRSTVEPGVVLDQLNAFLKPHGVWFPVDVSTSAQATLGGMAGNNSCGSRSIAYGNMVHNVHADRCAALRRHAGAVRAGSRNASASPPVRRLIDGLARSARASATRSRSAFRRCCVAWAATTSTCSIRRASALHRDGSVNLAHLLVGSEGTLAWTRRSR
jgi:FAD/FMN-containing dehydrogenase